MENRGKGRPMDESRVQYKVLLREMHKAGMTPCQVAQKMGKDKYMVCRKMRGQKGWKLYEAFWIKEIIGSTLPIDELFQGVEW